MSDDLDEPIEYMPVTDAVVVLERLVAQLHAAAKDAALDLDTPVGVSVAYAVSRQWAQDALAEVRLAQ